MDEHIILNIRLAMSREPREPRGALKKTKKASVFVLRLVEKHDKRHWIFVRSAYVFFLSLYPGTPFAKKSLRESTALGIGKNPETSLGAPGAPCLVLSNTRRGWANVPRWGERQRRWLAALLPLP
jgi:hypothetical protein